MADASKNQGFDEIWRKVGPDATAMFDNSASNPTEHASSEATNAATAGDDEDLEEEDDDAAAEEEDDEEDEEEDVEDEAGL
jgi:ribosomal protein L12E/L44/L45/RPP1/RPP2